MNHTIIKRIAISTLALSCVAPAFANPAHGGRSEREPAAVPAPSHDPHGARPHWSYEDAGGPEAWGNLSEEFAACSKGHMQSPIDLGGAAIAPGFTVKASYRPGPLIILNNGHTVQVSVPAGSTLTSGISRYKLLQLHFHTPSEETVYGIHYPMVAHFVHVDYAGNLAVLAVLFEEGPPNPELAKIIKAAPRGEAPERTMEGISFDPSRLLPDNLSVYRYEGSLTTPPCTEGVRWHVVRQRTTASAEQIASLHLIMGDNARPTQPLYGRVLVAGAD